MQRLALDDYFMGITKLVANRSTCMRAQVGAIIIKDKRILATGYNGAPRGMKHCHETGCLREKMKVPSGQRHELCRGVHAEQNAIIQAALFGTSIEGATIYTTVLPCSICLKMLINVGVKEIVFLIDYSDELSKQILSDCPQIKLRQIGAGLNQEKFIEHK